MINLKKEVSVRSVSLKKSDRFYKLSSFFYSMSKPVGILSFLFERGYIKNILKAYALKPKENNYFIQQTYKLF